MTRTGRGSGAERRPTRRRDRRAPARRATTAVAAGRAKPRRPRRRPASYNRLSPAQAESLALLLEELGEAQQAIGKILRHGLYANHPATGVVNRAALERELGDVRAAVMIACGVRLCGEDEIGGWCRSKLGKICQYLHHVKIPAAMRYPR